MCLQLYYVYCSECCKSNMLISLLTVYLYAHLNTGIPVHPCQRLCMVLSPRYYVLCESASQNRVNLVFTFTMYLVTALGGLYNHVYM